MADYSWFRLLVRALGLVFIGLAAPQAVSWLFWMATSYRQSFTAAGTPAVNLWDMIIQWSGYFASVAAQLGFGLYLFFGGEWVIRRCLRDVYGRCAACGYDVAGHAGSVCPECGVVLAGRSAVRTAAGDAAPVGRVG